MKEIVSVIEELYPFTSNQIKKWGTIKRKIATVRGLNVNSVKILNKYISMLGDAHTSIKSLTQPEAFYNVDIRWKDNALYVLKNTMYKKINRINGRSLATIVSQYQNEYGLPRRFIIRQIVHDIKHGDKLVVEYEDAGVRITEEMERTKISDIISGMTEVDKEMIKSLKSTYVGLIDRETILIKISSFYSREMIEEFYSKQIKIITQDIKNVIIDLRDNNGGYISIAKEMTAFFLGKDVLMDYEVVNNKNERERYIILSNGIRELINKRLILWVNENTQSCAEYIMARGLKLGHEGIISIGRPTIGLSGQAKEFIIDDKYLLSVTTKRYVEVGSNNCVGNGITPEILVESLESIKEDVYWKKTKELLCIGGQ